MAEIELGWEYSSQQRVVPWREGCVRGCHCTLTCSQKAACTAHLRGRPPPRCPACAGSRPQTAETRMSVAEEPRMC